MKRFVPSGARRFLAAAFAGGGEPALVRRFPLGYNARMRRIRLFFVAGLCFWLAGCAATAKKKPDNEFNPQYQYDKAVVAMKYRLPDQAVEYIQKALTLDPRHYPSWALLGRIRLQAGDPAGAAEAFEKSLEIKGDSVEALSGLADSFLRLEKRDKARDAFRRSFAIDGNVEAGFNLAKILYAENEFGEALTIADQVILKAEREAGAYNLKGVILNQLKRYPEAMATFRTALALTPSDINVNVNLAIACMNAKEYVEARRFFEKALTLVKDETLKKRIEEYLKILKDSGY
jgi:tetratricopeptide (TPR) repeat protein